jgi:hypothetical protein
MNGGKSGQNRFNAAGGICGAGELVISHLARPDGFAQDGQAANLIAADKRVIAYDLRQGSFKGSGGQTCLIKQSFLQKGRLGRCMSQVQEYKSGNHA